MAGTLTSTLIASAVGVIGAIITNYYVTQDTIDAKFEDWQAKLEITAREDERRSQVSELSGLQNAFHLHINHLKLYHRISFDFHISEAVIVHQPFFAFSDLSDEDRLKMISSLEDNIAQAQAKRFQLERDMAESDASYKATLETVLYRHHDDCVAAFSKVPSLIEQEMNETRAYFAEISPYVQSQSEVKTTRSEFIGLLKSSEKHVAAFDLDKPISHFGAATELCHGTLEAKFSALEES